MNTDSRGKLYLAAAFFLAGSSVVAAGYVTDTLAPFTITTLSLGFAVATALMFGNVRLFTSLAAVGRRQWLDLTAQALTGVVLFRVFLTFGLLRTSAAEAGILIGTSPAITAVLTRVFLGEPLSGNKLAGIGATLAGMAVLQGFPFALDAFSMTHITGNLLVLGAAGCESVFVIVSRSMALSAKTPAARLDPVVHSGYVSAISLVACLPFMLWENQAHLLCSLAPDSWLALAWYGGMVTIVAFACMFYGARTSDGYTLAAFSGLLPVSALLLSLTVLGETMAVRHIIGCGCIVAAVLIMNRR